MKEKTTSRTDSVSMVAVNSCRELELQKEQRSPSAYLLTLLLFVLLVFIESSSPLFVLVFGLVLLRVVVELVCVGFLLGLLPLIRVLQSDLRLEVRSKSDTLLFLVMRRPEARVLDRVFSAVFVVFLAFRAFYVLAVLQALVWVLEEVGFYVYARKQRTRFETLLRQHENDSTSERRRERSLRKAVLN